MRRLAGVANLTKRDWEFSSQIVADNWRIDSNESSAVLWRNHKKARSVPPAGQSKAGTKELMGEVRLLRAIPRRIGVAYMAFSGGRAPEGAEVVAQGEEEAAKAEKE